MTTTTDDAGTARTRPLLAARRGAPTRLRPTPADLVIAAASGLALALRLYYMSRPGLLTGVTEYDDGVYFGSAVRLVNGALPYRDFVLVQPPGIVLLMAPVALLAKATGTGTAFAIARLASAVAGAAGIPLAGWLVRHRGPAACAVVCGMLAAFPGGLTAAHTVLLEPWLVLFCLLGAAAVFHGDALTDRPGRLAAGGAALGVAVAVKVWALIPLAVIVLLCLRPSRRRALRPFLAGALVALGLAILPFFLPAPHAFYRDVVVAQASRVDVTRFPFWLRLVDLTGARAFSPVSPEGARLTALGFALFIGLSVAAAGLRERRLPPPLDSFAFLCTALTLAAFLWPADYYFHYSWFFAPFLALSLGLSADRLARMAGRGWVVAAATVAVATVVAWASEQDFVRVAAAGAGRPAPLAHRQIPPGACVLTDLQDFTLVSDRFVSSVPGCSVMVDAIGTDYALAHGRNGVTGAGNTPAVQALWLDAFRHAGYVWLQCPPTAGPGCLTNRRIPWTPTIRAYFVTHFVRAVGRPSLANLYIRSRP